MKSQVYSHRFADIILNSDYDLKKEIEQTIAEIQIADLEHLYEARNAERLTNGKKLSKGKQSALNAIFRERFSALGWETEKNVFGDPDNDLAIDFWKRNVGIDIAFNHRSFTGGDLLRLQAAAEVKKIMKVGVYICGTNAFVRQMSKDGDLLPFLVPGAMRVPVVPSLAEP